VLQGYFSMVGLLRVHCLIGDYRSALKAVEPIDMDKSGMFTKVPGCYITTLYYTGFGQMMMKR
jgi:translation initiation factor 3 subunit L